MTTPTQNMNTNANTNANTNNMVSIYIPRINSYTTEEQLVHAFSQQIGPVKRIDFAPIGKSYGFGEHQDTEFRCAFVHFHYWYANPLVSAILHTINRPGGCYRFHYCNTNVYWMLIKNYCPIPDTIMNTHQIVENCRILERSVKTQSIRIENLEMRIENYETKIDRLEETVRLQTASIFQLQEVVYQLMVKEETECEQEQEQEDDYADMPDLIDISSENKEEYEYDYEDGHEYDYDYKYEYEYADE